MLNNPSALPTQPARSPPDTHKFESRYLDGLIGPYPEVGCQGCPPASSVGSPAHLPLPAAARALRQLCCGVPRSSCSAAASRGLLMAWLLRPRPR
jgi:hypothetical protein